MHGFLKHEVLKSRSRFIALTVGLTVLLSCYFLYTGWVLSQINFAANQRVSYSVKSQQLEDDVNAYLEKNTLSEEDNKIITTNLNTQKQLLQNMIHSNFNDDWKSELNDAVNQLKLEQTLISNGVLPYNQYISHTLARDEYFLNHSIRPKNSDSACDGLNVLVMISQKFLPFLLIASVLLLSLSSWLSEIRSGSIKLLLWQAQKKRKILFDKFFISWIESTMSIFAFCFVVFLICWLIFGIGEGQYPIFSESGQVTVTSDFVLYTVCMIPIATFVLTAVCSLLTGEIVLNSHRS